MCAATRAPERTDPARPDDLPAGSGAGGPGGGRAGRPGAGIGAYAEVADAVVAGVGGWRTGAAVSWWGRGLRLALRQRHEDRQGLARPGHVKFSAGLPDRSG